MLNNVRIIYRQLRVRWNIYNRVPWDIQSILVGVKCLFLNSKYKYVLLFKEFFCVDNYSSSKIDVRHTNLFRQRSSGNTENPFFSTTTSVQLPDPSLRVWIDDQYIEFTTLSELLGPSYTPCIDPIRPPTRLLMKTFDWDWSDIGGRSWHNKKCTWSVNESQWSIGV